MKEKITIKSLSQKERKENDYLIVAPWPAQEKIDSSILQQFIIVSETITGIRNIRKEKNISPKQKIKLYLNRLYYFFL